MNNAVINAIENGYVIDHIPCGRAVLIVNILKLMQPHCQLIIGLNLDSKKHGHKDLIKIKNTQLSEEDFANIAVFAPNANVNVIKDFKISKKFDVSIPDFIHNTINCNNPNCITQTEETNSCFKVIKQTKTAKLCCHYCERIFSHDELIGEQL